MTKLYLGGLRKKERRLKNFKSEMKMGHNYWFFRNKKDYKRGLWMIVHQPTGWGGWNGQIPRKTKPIKIKS